MSKMLKAIQVRLYPTAEQQGALSRSLGCARWYWNHALNACIQHYQETGKTLKLATYKRMLPQLKKDFPRLKENCYFAVLQCVAINLNKAYINFFQGRAKFPRFKSKQSKQSIQYPQNVTVDGDKLVGSKIGEIKAVFHREIAGTIKTVTISKTRSGKYFASILCETEDSSRKSLGDKTLGIDLGLKDFAIVRDGEQVSKYSNPKHLKRKEGKLIEIDRFFPSSKKCSYCGHVIDKLPLGIGEWDCPSCGTHHGGDGNAASNIRNEGLRILIMGGGNPVPASRACVRPDNRKVKGQRAVKLEAHTHPLGDCG